MKVYVELQGRSIYKVHLRKPPARPDDVKEFDVPRSAAYLLLAAQASADALEDSLETMWRNGATNLHWDTDDEGRGPGGGG